MKIFRIIITLLVISLALITPAFLSSDTTEQLQKSTDELQTKALFAGGCFWCMEKPFEELEGVDSVVSGYAGGTSTNPTYKNYSSGGHLEVVQITYNPERISYETLLDIFWKQIDPTDSGGQFVDRGHEYSSAIFFYDNEQKRLAMESKENLEKSNIFNGKIVTPIVAATPFWPAEEYHQDYYKKNPLRYKYYRSSSGRDQFLTKHWKKRAQGPITQYAEAIKSLSPVQYEVTQKDGTEPAYHNLYWDNKEPGIYVDIVSGEPLFSSTDKYDSKTGWPSFTRPLITENIVERSDMTWLMIRTEVRSKKGNSHLGHVFNDGPPPTKLRYCINSAALRFIPAAELKEKGYAEFTYLFSSQKSEQHEYVNP